MKISDFLRMKITPDNKQFDMIKNIRFMNEKNDILVGKGTTTVRAFCDSFFDYVYRNYNQARGAEKLIKSNRKKYQKFSGSESMILVQRILEEIVNEYAISNYHITCEMDNSAAKKATAAVTEKKAEIPVQKPAVQTQAEKQPQMNTVVQSQQAVPQKNTANTQNNTAASVKIKALESELVRMQPKEEIPVEPKADDISDVMQDVYIHPVIEKKEEPDTSDVQIEKESVKEDTVAEEIPEKIDSPVENTVEEVIPESIPEENKKTDVQEEKISAEPQNTDSQDQNNQDQNNQGNQNDLNQGNQNNKKNHKDKRPPIEEARLRPGKGIPPIKGNLKAATKFQNAAVTKSNLKIEDIPCIAVIEENIVPTMEEVPFIGVPEDHSVPTMKEVPYVGVDEFGNPVESRSIYLKVDPPKDSIPVQTPPVVEKTVQAPVQIQMQPVQAPVQPSAQMNNVQNTVQPSNIPVKNKKSGRKSFKDVRQIVAQAIESNRQVIFTGPSGTGKTYQVRKYARSMTKGYDGSRFVQFHSGYEYSDFIEGLRPANIINTTAPTNVRLDGVFKAFCRKIVEDNLEHAIPGFGSMYAEKKQKVLQSLYEKIRDRKEEMEEGTVTHGFDHDSEEYIFDNGVRDYYFIIDELNRADVTNVFGDVLFSLDEDYRGIENRFDTRLSNLKSYRIIQAEDIGKANYSTTHIGFAEQMKFDCFERGFFIPRNLHIICTMNEIQSTGDGIGFAFRHRFRCVDINPDDIMLTSLRDIHRDKNIFWLDRFAENVVLINGLISDGFSPEYRLGPAYFRKLDGSPNSIDVVFESTIEPLLKEYLKGQPKDIAERFISECQKALHMGI